jgi:hypothetical protein
MSSLRVLRQEVPSPKQADSHRIEVAGGSTDHVDVAAIDRGIVLLSLREYFGGPATLQGEARGDPDAPYAGKNLEPLAQPLEERIGKDDLLAAFSLGHVAGNQHLSWLAQLARAGGLPKAP